MAAGSQREGVLWGSREGGGGAKVKFYASSRGHPRVALVRRQVQSHNFEGHVPGASDNVVTRTNPTTSFGVFTDWGKDSLRRGV